MNDTKTAEIGPVQLLAVGFGPGAKFEGKAQLRDQGVITDADFEAKKKQVLGI
jgi:putative oligomerization/nucleic acid binding protein